MKYDDEIESWVEWFRGLNNREIQRKVAERQMAMLKAEKRIVHWEAVYDSRRGYRLIMDAANAIELKQLEDCMPDVFPKVPHGPRDQEARERFQGERDVALENLIEVLSAALKKR